MNLSRIIILARRVAQQLVADKRTLALIIVVPVILLTVAGVLIRVEPSGLTIAVVNQDEGLALGSQSVNLGDRLTENLQNFDLFDTKLMTAEEAKQKIEDGELDAVITLPPNLSAEVAQSRQLNLNVQFEGSNPTVAERLRNAFERVGDQALAGLATLQAGNESGGGNPSTAAIETNLDTTYLNGGPEFDTLDYTASALIGVFVFLFVFILTSISFLRERLAGTLERLQATPIQPLEIIIGYMLGFLIFGLLQGVITLLYTVFVLNIHYHGNLLNVFVIESLLVVVSVNLGIFLSTFARNEFQVLQFIPLVVVTQVFLGGVLWPIEEMPGWLQPIAYMMPLTHANTALRAIMMTGESLGGVWVQIGALVAIGAAVIGLSARTAGRVRM
ncbi:MAG: ABC transporter permease [Chloroflexota bacterium]|nr:ABC transporter permease [Chloroflexota bacterium]NOG63961.1 ABC transporter permease [Chloroflexota bacterium]GIK65735.1 MAG: ABC transporter permease [Chloroflexota bacterium]